MGYPTKMLYMLLGHFKGLKAEEHALSSHRPFTYPLLTVDSDNKVPVYFKCRLSSQLVQCLSFLVVCSAHSEACILTHKRAQHHTQCAHLPPALGMANIFFTKFFKINNLINLLIESKNAKQIFSYIRCYSTFSPHIQILDHQGKAHCLHS